MNKDEKILRENIQKLIRFVKTKKLNEEKEIRNSLKKLMRLELKHMLSEASTPDVDPAPNKSTGINVLEELLKKIIPVLEADFKSLTTSEDQRQSFRAHIINAVIDTLTPAKINTQAGESEEKSLEEEMPTVSEDQEIKEKNGFTSLTGLDTLHKVRLFRRILIQ